MTAAAVMTTRVLTVVEDFYLTRVPILYILYYSWCSIYYTGATPNRVYNIFYRSIREQRSCIQHNSTTIVHRIVIVIIPRPPRDVRNPCGQWLITVKCLGRVHYRYIICVIKYLPHYNCV